jgi:putative sigma-54 modulation protein
MDLNVYFGNLKPAQAVREQVSELMLRSFASFHTYIRHISLTITDVNGPKGGVDKQCHCVLHLKRMPPIVIRDRDESYLGLFHRVANRASHVLSQRVDRKQTGYRSHKRLVNSGDPPPL